MINPFLIPLEITVFGNTDFKIASLLINTKSRKNPTTQKMVFFSGWYKTIKTEQPNIFEEKNGERKPSLG